MKRNGLNVPGQTNAALTITNLRSSDAGTYTLEIGYPGASAIYGTSVMTIIDAPAYVVGQWDFDNADLSANCGQPLQYFDPDVDNNTGFAGSDFFALPQLDNQEVSLMAFPGVLPGALPMGGYKMRHGLAGNGGGTNLNQYTLIADIIYPASSHDQFRSLLQTDPNNADDGEFLINPTNGIGANGVYQGSLLANTWYRIALAVDLSGPGPSAIVAKFINGVKVAQQLLTEGRDGRWSLSANPAQPWALLFADNDVDVQPGYVSSIQLRNGRCHRLAGWPDRQQDSRLHRHRTQRRSTRYPLERRCAPGKCRCNDRPVDRGNRRDKPSPCFDRRSAQVLSPETLATITRGAPVLRMAETMPRCRRRPPRHANRIGAAMRAKQ